MKSFKDKLSEPEMKAVAAYVKQLGAKAGKKEGGAPSEQGAVDIG